MLTHPSANRAEAVRSLADSGGHRPGTTEFLRNLENSRTRENTPDGHVPSAIVRHRPLEANSRAPTISRTTPSPPTLKINPIEGSQGANNRPDDAARRANDTAVLVRVLQAVVTRQPPPVSSPPVSPGAAG